MEFDIGKLYRETLDQLHAAELHAAELRGQVRLLESLLAAAQRPIMSGDPIGDAIPPVDGNGLPPSTEGVADAPIDP